MKKLLLFGLFTASSYFSTAQWLVYTWGAESWQGMAAGQFQNDFVESNTNTYSGSEWTSVTLFDGNGSGAASQAHWKRTTLLYSEGVNSDMIPLNSPSAMNGAAIFDSDYLDNGGITNNAGNGASPANHRSELVSPTLDLTGYTDSIASLKMYLKYDAVNFVEASVSFSTDNGTTWGVPTDITANHPNSTEGFTSIKFPISTLTGVANLTSCRLKFTFEGSYNYIMIDDISLFSGSTNASGTNQFVNSFSTIAEQACGPYTSPSGNYTWTTSGTYYDTIPNSFNIDSIMTIQLNVGAHTSATQTETALDSYTWPVNNQTYTASGQYTAVIPNASGCDSTITLDLTMNFTGLEENDVFNLILYPNPTSDMLMLQSQGEQIGKVLIADLSGKIVSRYTIEGDSKNIDVRSLNAGTYLLYIESLQQVIRFVKE